MEKTKIKKTKTKQKHLVEFGFLFFTWKFSKFGSIRYVGIRTTDHWKWLSIRFSTPIKSASWCKDDELFNFVDEIIGIVLACS